MRIGKAYLLGGTLLAVGAGLAILVSHCEPGKDGGLQLRSQEAIAQRLDVLEQGLARIDRMISRRNEVSSLPVRSGGAPREDRLPTVEARVENLTNAVKDCLEAVREWDVMAPLAGPEDELIRADYLLECGKPVTAGSAYRTWLKRYAGHPEAERVRRRARDAFERAGDLRVIQAQEDVLRACVPAECVDETLRLASLMRIHNREVEGIDLLRRAVEASADPVTRGTLLERLGSFLLSRPGSAPEAIAAFEEARDLLSSAGLEDRAEQLGKLMQEASLAGGDG